MRLTSKSLANGHIRLEPFREDRKEELRLACAADPATWTEIYPYSMLDAGFDFHWARICHEGVEGKTIPFAVVVDGVCRGMTAYLEIDGTNHGVEIGATYYEPSARGGPVNPSAKRLLLGHAYDCGATRV